MTERLRRILRRLPSWLRFRYDADTVGQQLVDGLQAPIELATKEIAAAANELHLGHSSEVRPAWIYQTAIDTPLSGDSLTVIGNGFELAPVADPLTFLRSQPTDPMYEVALAYANPYLYDPAFGMLYVRKPYAETPEAPGGFVDVLYHPTMGLERQVRYRLSLHHVWNAVDEFALLAGLTRREGEENQALRERIWDRFRLPRHEGPSGITSRLAQALGALREVVWTDPTVALTLPEPHVLADLVLVNGQPLATGAWRIDAGDRVELRPRTELSPLTIRYVAGIRARAATAVDVTAARHSIEEATPRWGLMRYDLAFWMPDDVQSARLPIHYDADLSVWR